ncbi:MAG: DsbA family protein [Asticcacaulis sp.]|uniref:DsbA family protein n=1 Tax=Asticcacaulis sp. TaxID=1872648 RepID=UPI003F7C0B0B
MRITYLFDPLCGWCYGASPALERLSVLEDVTIALAPTGLFAGDHARPMDAQFAAYAWQNDQRIQRLTGQVFSEAYRTNVLNQAGGLFDSAPATLAVVAVGLTDPAGQIVALKALQRARYVDGRNNSDMAVVADVLSDAGFTEAAVQICNPVERLLAAYRQTVAAARADMARFGANGVPALVVGEGAGRHLLRTNALFTDFEQLTEDLRRAA